MEVGLWRTVFQCPVAFAAVGQFDDGTDAEQQRVIGRQQFPGDGCIQLETVRGAVQGNPWCCGGEKIRIAFPVIVETIACPLARWRKIEFLVFFPVDRGNKYFAARVLPKMVGRAGRLR